MTNRQRVNKSIRVLDFKGPQDVGRLGKFACFSQPDMDSPNHIDLPIRDWDELGRPLQITITIEPGDSLNEEDPHHNDDPQTEYSDRSRTEGIG